MTSFQRTNAKFQLFIATLLFFMKVATAAAEHRVALLIGNSGYQHESFVTPAKDVQGLARLLEQRGFRCQVCEDLDADGLKSTIEIFANSTPTRGTALVYFGGQVLKGNSNSKDGIFFVATNVKNDEPKNVGNSGIAIEQVLELLSTRGGSSLNLVVADAVDPPAFSEPLPQNCLLAYTDTKKISDGISPNGDLIKDIQNASAWSDTNFEEKFTATGKGSSAVGPPDKFVQGKQAGDEWVNARGIVFCWCPPGSYTSGSPEGEPQRYPDELQREVVIEHGFWIGKYELTLRENIRNRPRDAFGKHKNDPLTMLHLDDARSMTTRNFSETERKQGRLPEDWQYSLPTEEQWEYAARAGTKSRFYFGDDLNELPRHANFGDKRFYDSKNIFSNAAHRTLDDGVVTLARVGSFVPNPWGLYDVYGNVAEWCVDNALRGGSWISSPDHCRSAYRDSFSSRSERKFIGFRIVIQKVPPKPEQK